MAQGLFTLKQVNQATRQGAWSAPANYVGSFDGSTQYLFTPTSANLTFGTGDFTIECWVYVPALATRGVFQTTSAAGFPGTQSGIGVYLGSSGNWNAYFAGASYTSPATYSANQWLHLAVCRSGTTSRFFINGVSVQSATDSTNYTQSYFALGGFISTSYLWSGQISNFRVLKGTALYTANFTPPTNRLTAITNTQLLTLQDATIIDNSSNNFTLSNTGTVVTSLQYPFSSNKTPIVDYLVVAGGGGAGNGGGGGGGGGLLAGIANVSSGSAITVTVGAGGAGSTSSGTAGTSGQNSVLGSINATGGGGGGTFNSSATTGNSGLAGGSGGGGASGYTGIAAGSAGQGVSGQGNAGGITVANFNQPYTAGGGGGAGTPGRSTSGDYQGPFGGSGFTSAISGTVTAYAGGGGGGAAGSSYSPTGIGGVGGGGNSSAVYTGAGGNGTANTGGGGGGGWGGNGGTGGSGIVILSYPDTYAAPTSTTGSPTVSTSGSGSISLNGSSQYLTSPANSVYNFGTGNFTLEAWVYCTSFASSPCIFDARATGTAVPWAFYINSSGQPYFYDGTVRNTTTSVSLNTWTHIAAVRNSGTLNIYINGVSGYSASNTTNITSTGTLQIAGAFSASFLPGYLSNARITNTAVYTANFTPSTTPLTAISGTQILLNTVSGAQFADSSSNSFIISTFASPTWNQASPFATGLGYKNRVYTFTASGTITF